MNKKYLFLLLLFIPSFCLGDICSQFKYDVDIDLNIKNNDADIKKSEENLVGKLGYTQDRLSYKYQLDLIPVPVRNGFCVTLRGITIEVLQDFNIVIDKRLKENSCAYDIVLKHEKDHENVFKTVLLKNKDYIHQSIASEIKKVEPVFIEKTENISEYYKNFDNMDFVKNIKTKIQNELNEENQKIDDRGDIFYVWKCEDFYKEMKDSNITID